MKMRVSLDGYAARLFAALALLPLAGCGKAVPCEGGKPVEAAGADSGYEQCDGSWMHRPAIVECKSALPRQATTCNNEGDSCSKDSDCTEKANGFCGFGGGDVAGCFCNYGCTKDADCGDGQICVCGDPVGYCTTASCKSDADCGGDKLCSTYVTLPGCGGIAFACQSASDECASDADCGDGYQCTIETDHRICGQINCAIGRPFLVGGSARVAELSRRGDWCATELLPHLDELTAKEREILAQEWLHSARMEHASIAAFARFSMQLLSLGAPPDLIALAHAAAIDESEHARACFAIASAYSGEPLGPGPLSMEGALSQADLDSIMHLAIVEGCIGETVAAVEAAEAAAHAEDAVIAGALARIAEDEGRHAELAWRFVRWALARHPEIARPVAASFASALATERAGVAGPASAEEEGWLRHGVARGLVKAEIRRRVIESVVAPAALALAGGPRRAERALAPAVA